MTEAAPSSRARIASPLPILARVIRSPERIPYWLLAIPLRIAVAKVFWSSALTHSANWDATLYLFANSYKVPLLPPSVAAWIAVVIEFAAPPLLIFGLATRLVSLILLGMVAVIEVFVYPQAWPTHIQWAAMLFVLLARGAGIISFDALIRRAVGYAG